MMITHEQLKDAILLQFPDLHHGVDFWVGHEVEGDTQISPARIYEWKAADVPEPTHADIDAMWAKHKEQVLLSHAARDMRMLRDILLGETDIAINKATDAGNEGLVERLRTHRQALRDLPRQAGFPLQVEWPDCPV